ncbi:MAG: ribosome maturation factor RimM [Alphaproteobacteria bacterium]|nr:ribosome maturation factor RimM [Alphaproteobacteria bacterium]
MGSDRKIAVGQFAGAHGVRGLVKLRSFTEDPEAIFSYTPLLGKDRAFTITKKGAVKDLFIAAVDGIATKEEADRLRGDKIYIPRTLLPKTAADEYYEADLIGLRVSSRDGRDYGTVQGVFDYGGGVFLEIETADKKTFMLPFKNTFVPEVDIEGQRMIIVLPEGWP